jgi:hypothetical protein
MHIWYFYSCFNNIQKPIVMAVLKNGIFGPISGKLGNVVYVNNHGVNYIRTKPSVHKKSNSKAQKDTRLKFTLVFKFLKPFAEILAIGFKEQAKGKTGFNMAMSYNLKNAIVGSSPDFKISFSKILLSMGSIGNPQDSFITMAAPGIIAFNWIYDPQSFGNQKPDDVCLLIAFFESNQKMVYQITSTRRTVQKALLTIPEDLHGQKVHCWLAFKCAVRYKFSDSVYLGTMVV